MSKLFIIALLLVQSLMLNAQNRKQWNRFMKLVPTDTIAYINERIEAAETLFANDTLKAMTSLRQALRYAALIQNDYLQAKAYMAIGKIYTTTNIHNRALPNYSKAANLFYESGTRSDVAFAVLGIAKSQYYRGNYSRAAQTFLEAIGLAEKYSLDQVKGEANEYLGLIYGAFQNFQRNTDFYIISLEVKRRLKDAEGMIRIATSLSEIYYQQAVYDSALIYASMAVDLAKKSDRLTDMYMSHFWETASLIRLKKIEDAEAALKYFQGSDRFVQDANLQMHYQTLMGNYYLAKNEKNIGKLHYDSAQAIIKKNAFPELLIVLYNNMAQSYFQLGDVDKAYELSRQYNRQLSQFYTENNLTKLANLEGLVTLESTRDQVKDLSNENRLKALLFAQEQKARKNLLWENLLKDSLLKNESVISGALARENEYRQQKLDDEKKLNEVITSEYKLQLERTNTEKRIRSFLFFGLMLFSALGALIFFMYRKQKKKNGIIQRQASELETLIKEVHHRVKNNLQVISSLLDLQSVSIKDNQAASAVLEGKMRVQSMALIHQNLYLGTNLKSILMENYIKTLAENLLESYNINDREIKLVTDIDHLNLDVDTVIPLGLILNELISNSLKYAFAERPDGVIYVGLKRIDERLQLQVKDNGKGFPEGLQFIQGSSFGYSIISAFTKKLKAQLSIKNDNGACVSMEIFKYKIA